MKISQIKSYPARIWEEDIIEALHNIWMKELQEKLNKYKANNPNIRVDKYIYSENEFSCNGQIIKEMTIIFNPVNIDDNDK